MSDCIEVCYEESSSSASSCEKGCNRDSSSSPPRRKKQHEKQPFKPVIIDCLPRDAIPISQFKSYTECKQNPFNNWNQNQCSPCQPRPNCNPSNSFSKLDLPVPVNPMTGVIGVNSGLTNGYIMIKLRRRNETITLEWETFKGQIGSKNINYVTMNATLSNVPSFDVQVPIRTQVNGVHYIGYFYLDPASQAEKYQFRFDYQNNVKVNVGDSVTIYGSSATWISSC